MNWIVMALGKAHLVGIVTLAVCLVLVAPSAVLARGDAPGDVPGDTVVVDPTYFEFFTTCGGEEFDTLCVMTPSGLIFNAVDILFIMDVTRSMIDELDAVKSSALYIMAEIESLGVDAAYGVGSFRDYPDSIEYCGYGNQYGLITDFPWNMDQNITTDTQAISDAINALTAIGGEDWPECYSRALHESMGFSFRTGTKKILLMFGDAPVHDCDFLADRTSFGPDPGPNGIPGDGDDLNYETVVAALQTFGITVFSIDSSGQPPGGESYENFDYMATQTGGTHHLLSTASDIPDLIITLISEQAELINWLSLKVQNEPFKSWFSTTPTGYADVGGPDTLCFKIRIAPTNTGMGNFQFDILVDGDGTTLATVPVVLNLSGASAVKEMSWGELRNKFRNRKNKK